MAGAGFEPTTVLLASLALGIVYFRYRMRKVWRANTALRREITERKLAEAKARENAEQLARVSRAATMGELTTSIAHEIKQPLFAIVSNAQTADKLLNRDQPDIDEVRDALEDIARDGNRASQIIDRVRALVRKEGHVVNQLDLNEVVASAQQFAEPEMTKSGLGINTELADKLPAVQGDPIELQQVVLNLLLNGAQAMRDGGGPERILTISTTQDNGSVELAVSDVGPGVPEEHLPRLFNPFFTTRSDGTGMGLAINRSIVEAHGGRIWASLNSGPGMTFHVSLPVSEASS